MLRIRIACAALTATIIGHGVPATALNTSRDISQYGHAKWTLRDGGLRGYPRSIAQTRDGFLWLATDFGLRRFDGVRFTPWEPPPGSPLPGVAVRLLATRDGSLWIGTDQGLARWNDGVLSAYRELAGEYVYALAEDRDGTVWVGTNGRGDNAELCSIQGETVDCDGDERTLGRFVLAILEDEAGELWVGTATGLWRWGETAPTQYALAAGPSEINALVDDGRGAIVVAMARQLARLVDGSLEPYPVDDDLQEVKPTSLLHDRRGGLWIGTQDNGLLHLLQDGRTRRLGRVEGLSGTAVVDIFEDREGSVWVATLGGLDRFRDVAVGRLSTREGLDNDVVLSVLATTVGDVWMSTVSGLERWSNGVVQRYTIPGVGATGSIGALFEDSRGRVWVSSSLGLFSFEPGATRPVRAGLPVRHVHGFAEDAGGTLWISDLTSGLFGLRGDDGEVVPWLTLGGKSARALFAGPSGGLWLGFVGGGVSRLENGRVQRTYTSADGLGAGDVNNIHDDRDGALWVATEGGLSRIAGGRVDTLDVRNGLPCDAVKWSIEDDTGALWLQTDCGLVRVERDDLNGWISDPASRVDLVAYDASDGALGYADLGSYGPKVTRAADGRLWFAGFDGVGIIDPRALPSNPVPPPVHVERIVADGVTHAPPAVARLPARVRDVSIEYTALSLGAPEKVAFRYRLEGRDEDWVEAGNRRQAFYTDLPPGSYRFRVIAANDRGLWNEDGAAWAFSIAPAYYQTNAFRLAAVASVILGLTLLYRLRLRRATAQLQARLQERLDERARVAQALHDTLFQGFASSSMQLHVVADEIADQKARSKLTREVQRMNRIIDEGRESVSALRVPDGDDDLEGALARDAEHFKGERQIDVRLAVKGKPRPLRPLARDAVYQISREALANTFRHARAKHVEVDVEYSRDELTVRVRDDGRGMAPPIVDEGRPGHFGLPGMRERAEQIGAALRLWSREGAGTEVEIHLPAKTAFPNAPPYSRARWWRAR